MIAMEKKKIWAVIPAYNEERRIGPVISAAKKYVQDVLVIDDGSSDETLAFSEKHNVLVLRHMVNLGKGAALKTGCDYAIAHGADIIVTLDADAQHRPEDIPRFLHEIGKAEMVFGCRSLNKKMPAVLRFGNWAITQLTSFLYRVNIPDTQSGFRAFTKEAYRKIRWEANDYSMESEMIANVGKHRIPYRTITIETIYPDRYKGTTVIDGVKIVLNLLKWKIVRNGW